jgi:cytochrome c oxidase subunit 2
MKRIVTLFLLLIVNNTSLADLPVDWQIDFQEAASPIMQELKRFHDFLLIITSSIVIFVFLLLAYVVIRFNAHKNPIPATFTHNIAIEIIWTVIPILILIVIAIPSFKILRTVEHMPPTEMTIKVVGSQWFWTYSYPDHDNLEFDSYLISKKDLKPGQHRLLEVDRRNTRKYYR